MLLDSHVLLWILEDLPLLGNGAKTRVLENRCWFSSASIWELEIKAGKNKLRLPGSLSRALTQSGLRELPVSALHAEHTSKVALPHRDPFDRMLLSQALAEGMPLMTADHILLRHAPLDSVIDATV